MNQIENCKLKQQEKKPNKENNPETKRPKNKTQNLNQTLNSNKIRKQTFFQFRNDIEIQDVVEIQHIPFKNGSFHTFSIVGDG